MNKVMPALRTRFTGTFIDRMIDFTIDRMEVAAAARKRVLKNVAGDIMDEIVDEAVRAAVARVDRANAERLSQVDVSKVHC